AAPTSHVLKLLKKLLEHESASAAQLAKEIYARSWDACKEDVKWLTAPNKLPQLYQTRVNSSAWTFSRGETSHYSYVSHVVRTRTSNRTYYTPVEVPQSPAWTLLEHKDMWMYVAVADQKVYGHVCRLGATAETVVAWALDLPETVRLVAFFFENNVPKVFLDNDAYTIKLKRGKDGLREPVYVGKQTPHMSLRSLKGYMVPTAVSHSFLFAASPRLNTINQDVWMEGEKITSYPDPRALSGTVHPSHFKHRQLRALKDGEWSKSLHTYMTVDNMCVGKNFITIFPL
ncbi:hypothetical protein, partial [Salmonella enterica]|uniref:hypothetical protein n=1 Tax=Salmonella enterica TaxID=28901 RepID=UPI00135F0965